jgi:hypothetical protein
MGGIGPGRYAKGDTRYDIKIKYEHDAQGHRIKTQRFNNLGKLVMWVVMKYDPTGNRIEERFYSTDSDQYMKITSTYDAKGNVLESSYDLEDNRFDQKSSYSYDFDAQGNWTRRVRSKWVTKDGKSSFVPTDVSYRKITYF